MKHPYIVTWNRVRFAMLLIAALGALSGCSYIYHHYGSHSDLKPNQLFQKDSKLSKHASEMINTSFEGFENQTMHDYHFHFFGMDKPKHNSYCTKLNDLVKGDRPSANLKKVVCSQEKWFIKPFIVGTALDTMHVDDPSLMDQQHMEYLVTLVSNYGPPNKANDPDKSPYSTSFYIMAMDGVYDATGTLDKEETIGFVSNRYMVTLVKCLNDKIAASGMFTQNRFVAVGSINPMQSTVGHGMKMRDFKILKDEIQYLEENDVQFIKWRPATMDFDPALVSDEFYLALRDARIGILTHTGSSAGIHVNEKKNGYASPARLKDAVDLGVTVVMLHTGRKGPEEGRAYSDIALEMLKDNPDKPLFGEVSVVPYGKTYPLMNSIIKNAENGKMRFVNGSDYSAMAAWYVVGPSLDDLETSGWITTKDKEGLIEIFKYNPLLFDFVLKRTMATPKDGIAIPLKLFLGIQALL